MPSWRLIDVLAGPEGTHTTRGSRSSGRSSLISTTPTSSWVSSAARQRRPKSLRAIVGTIALTRGEVGIRAGSLRAFGRAEDGRDVVAGLRVVERAEDRVLAEQDPHPAGVR